MSFTNIKNLENPGVQKICIDTSGSDKETVYVCDAEGSVLKFNKQSLLSDEKPEIIEISDTTTSSLAWNGKNICFGYRKVDFIGGTEQQVVGHAKDGDFQAERITDPLEFQLDVTTVDANEENVAAGSSDYAVKCTSLKDPDAELKTRMLEAEVLCVKLDPRNEYLAVSTVDGCVTIIKMDDFSVCHTLTGAFPKFRAIDVTNPRIHISWSKDGSWLFVPSKGTIKSYRRKGWEESGNYRLKDHADVIFSVTAVSSCGKYLAASSMDNQVAVWDSEEMDLLKSEQFKRNAPGSTIITSIEFSPFSTNQLIIADSNKGVCLFNFTADSPSVSSDGRKVGVEASANDSDDDDSLILNRTSLKKDNLFNEEAMEDDEDTRMSSDIGAIKRKFNYDNQDIGGLEEFGFRVGEPDEFRPLTPNAQVPNPTVYSEPVAPRKVLIPEKFVCNSSPIDPEAAQRFLKYNRAGIVRSYVNEANKISTIDIEFHNKNIHGDIHIDNFDINYELADISTKVVALASLESRRKEKEIDKATDEIEELESNSANNKNKKGTSVLHVIPVQSFDNHRWSMTMPRGDGVVDVLCSTTQVVVLTKKRNVRVFTIGGLQRQIFTHPAPILTAACFEDRIAIASVVGSEFYENKKVPQWRFEVNEYSLQQKSWYREPKQRSSAGAVSRIDVPVQTGEQLDWLAYSTQGKLTIMDSASNVHILSSPGLWVPVFDGSSVLGGPSDNIFPVCLTTKEFRYIYCRGSRAPLVNGINAPTTVEWKLPFCEPESTRTEMEQTLFLNELSMADAILEKDGNRSQEENKKMTATIVKLFAWLLKTNEEGQAAEVAALVSGGASSSAKTIQSLCNYASKCKKVALSEKVAEIGRQMAEGNDVRKNEDVEIRPSKKVVLMPKKYQKERSPVEHFPKSTREEMEDVDRQEEEDDSRYNMNLDVSMSSQPFQPMERLSKNPFAKGADKQSGNDSASSSQATLSIFDQLETTVDNRKRGHDNERPVNAANPPARKQAKLSFESQSEKKKSASKPPRMENLKEKENEVEEVPSKKSVSPYEMWLSESKSALQSEFNGEDADFTKYCIQTFRSLSKNQKEEWKAKALAAAES